MASVQSRISEEAQEGVFFRRPSEFLNRDLQLETLDAELDHQRRDSLYFKVCEITGLGGMGKSRLLDEAMAHAKARPEKIDHVVFLSLERESSGTEVGVLFHLRQSVKVNCYLFDAAVRRYWTAVGQPIQAAAPGRLERSVLVKGAELGAPLAGFPLPVNFAVQGWKKLRQEKKRLEGYEKSEFAAIDEIREDPRRLRACLPRCLALDLQRGLGSHSLAVFYDSYEKQENPEEGAPWLQELISTLGRGVHVIASREQLKWDARRWKRHIVPVKVAKLPMKESQEMLRQRLGELEEPIEQRLLKISRRIPFYIESAVNLYLDMTMNKEVTATDLPSTPRGAVANLLDHRRAPQRALATALATVQVFDQALYRYMADVLNVELAVLHYQDFLDSFLVERISGRQYKVHDLLTEIVHESAAEKLVRRVALEAATDHLVKRSQEGGRTEPEAVLAILQGLLRGWGTITDVPRRCMEALIDIAYILYDAGFSSELMSLASSVSKRSRHSVSLVADFILAMSTRRIAGVDAGLRRFEGLRSRKKRLGRHAQSLELELAYLREIRGNYRRARNDFRRLAGQVQPFDPGDRTQLRALLYHADVLIMDGKFREGSRLLQETYEAVGHHDLVNWGELVRHRAHAYRFSFLLEDAASLYLLALRKARDAPVLMAKLYTNLVETYCWHEPDRAMTEAVRSKEMNERLGHQIELSKCAAAKAIALSRLGRLGPARSAIDEAKQLARRAGYPAGLAFALQAEAVVAGLADETDWWRQAVLRLRRKTRELGTYDYLVVAPLVLAGESDAIAAALLTGEWFDPEEVETRIRRYLDP